LDEKEIENSETASVGKLGIPATMTSTRHRQLAATRVTNGLGHKEYFQELNRLGYIEGQNLIVERCRECRTVRRTGGD